MTKPVDQAAVALVYKKAPEELTDEDLDLIIEDWRNKRHLFKNNPGGAKPKAAPKLTQKQQELVGKVNLDIDL